MIAQTNSLQPVVVHAAQLPPANGDEVPAFQQAMPENSDKSVQRRAVEAALIPCRGAVTRTPQTPAKQHPRRCKVLGQLRPPELRLACQSRRNVGTHAQPAAQC